jgi:hypothetical protein
MDEFAQARDQQLTLTRGFEAACAELGLGSGSLDVRRKERRPHSNGRGRLPVTAVPVTVFSKNCYQCTKPADLIG